MRIGLAQINPTVGDVGYNAGLIRRAIGAAREQGAELVVFPELAIIGYPPRDLLLKPAVIRDCVAAVEELAGQCDSIAAIIGYPCPADAGQRRILYNAAAFCCEGRIESCHIKSLLPTYDVFDERRYFEPGPSLDLTTFGPHRLGISICEDLWNDEQVFTRQLYHDNPIDKLAQQGADLFINCAASPFVIRKHAFRLKLMSHVARTHKLPLLYCNQVGGNDELIFDGNSCAFDRDGRLIAHGRDFEDDLLMVDVDLGEKESGEGRSASLRGAAKQEARIETHREGMAAAYEALVLGLRDYCAKCGFKSIVMGLSGGIDSALSCAIAAAAIGSENVRGVAMPSRYSSAGSVDDAKALADNLSVDLRTIPIKDAHLAMENMLEPHFENKPADATEENIQARIRGVIMMAMSNKFGSLLVTTGNKSELAVGYCTLYGDMCGGFSVLSDVPKTMVYELSRWINEDSASPLRKQFGKAVIPQDTITKPPSAELKPGQVDQDSLPDYEMLDEIVERYVEREQSALHIIDQTGFDGELVHRMVRMIDRNEYKRKQAAPGLKITGRAFGMGRRMPIAQRYENF